MSSLGKKDILEIMVHELKDVVDELVFIGGATISIYIEETQHVTIRETFDVDCVVEVTNRTDYQKLIAKIKNLGFSEDIYGGVICRYLKGEMKLDVIPTDSLILGFSNKWYVDGFRHSITKGVLNREIRVFTLPYLIATKIEAFKGRGLNSYSSSHDIEDIITLIDGCPSVTTAIDMAELDVKKYLKQEFTTLLNEPYFLESLDGHISNRENIEGRKAIIISRIKKIIS